MSLTSSEPRKIYHSAELWGIRTVCLDPYSE